MKPAQITWALAMFEMMRAIAIVRRWSGDGDRDAALSRMPLEDVYRLRSRVICAYFLYTSAQIMWWLP